ncbi:hypothetical protein RN001_008899 [Aquatica leii]|uniref:Uncharacterized protein n=1 Tax=Aquatica leii TaxID=1421715 RepID=A0AAN7SPE7_9COLE|nr:hypothetical protein RN001_008899 [Aquatica leii]
MRRQKLFEHVHKNINKFEIRLDKYVVQPTSSAQIDRVPKNEEIFEERDSDSTSSNLAELKYLRAKELNADKFAAFAREFIPYKPKLCMWTYMNQIDIEKLIKITSKREIRKTIDNKMTMEYPKGISRLLAVEMMYSVLQFCKKSKFNIKQIGTMLSIFYLTHQYFLSSFYTSPEKTFIFFKEHLLFHCLECSPDSVQLFNYSESKSIATYFCKLYLCNLPLLRLLTLPNFAFRLHFDKLPQPEVSEDKKKK